MNKGTLFFFCACFITLLSVINLSLGPIISGKVGKDWGKLNCAKLVDDYDIALEDDASLNYKSREYDHEWKINECKRKKAMHDMEYTSFIFNLAIGFSCGISTLLHLFELNSNFISKTGLIGFITGIIGFILTFVYICYNGIVYTNYYEDTIFKRDCDGAFAVHDGGSQYKCIYYDEEQNEYSLYAKFSDLYQPQYNYDKRLAHQKPNEVESCLADPNDCYATNKHGYVANIRSQTCDKLYIYINDGLELGIENDTNKDKSSRFLTALILSLLICLGHIGLAIFGFLLFKAPSDFKQIENK